ncbi:hypothetical protein [Beggiatoa alba]|nr:hypothetical protein [Beggiatoa alba]
MFTFSPSPLQAITWADKQCWVKRDDLLHPTLNGNKARKLLYYLQHDFPNKTTLVSCGGNQSNAMLALAILAQLKQWQFCYYLKPLPQALHQQTHGNFQQAVALGMNYREIMDFSQIHLAPTDLWIPQGGASAEASWGLQTLADELTIFIQEKQLTDVGIFVPSGTGATAFYLQQFCDYPVYTTPCVGSSAYLQDSFCQLAIEQNARYPIILEQPQKRTFGKPDPTLFAIWQECCAKTGIEFDLLYDPLGWLALQTHQATLPNQLIYIHCGGLTGNPSMLARYQRLLRPRS